MYPACNHRFPGALAPSERNSCPQRCLSSGHISHVLSTLDFVHHPRSVPVMRVTRGFRETVTPAPLYALLDCFLCLPSSMSYYMPSDKHSSRKSGVLLLVCACNKQPVQVSALPPYHMYKEPSRSWFHAGLNPSTHNQLRCPFPPAAVRPTPVEAFLSLNSFMPLKKSYKLLVSPEGLAYNHKTRTTLLTPASYRIATTMRQAEVKRKTELSACRRKLTYVTI